MDRKPSKAEQIQRLTQSADAARAYLDRELIDLKHRLDVPARMRGSLKRHPSAWFLGSLGAGLAASLLLFRRKSVYREPKEKKHRSLPVAALGLTLTALRPLARIWLTDQVKNYLSGQSALPGASRFRDARYHP